MNTKKEQQYEKDMYRLKKANDGLNKELEVIKNDLCNEKQKCSDWQSNYDNLEAILQRERNLHKGYREGVKDVVTFLDV